MQLNHIFFYEYRQSEIFEFNKDPKIPMYEKN
jgi:hypothetical protein